MFAASGESGSCFLRQEWMLREERGVVLLEVLRKITEEICLEGRQVELAG